MPVNLLTNNFLTSSYDEKLSTKDFSVFSTQVRNSYIHTSIEPIISLHNFKTLIGFVLSGLLNHNEIYDDTWLQRIYFASQRNITATTTVNAAATIASSNDEKQLAKESDPLSSSDNLSSDFLKMDAYAENHEGLLWFWALWECAQFCVQAKLKTPLGKAQDTFVSIENAIKSYFSQTEVGKAAKNQDLFRVTLLVQFIECLEKLIYNAYEGTLCLPVFSKSVKLFFRTNKPTCNEWFCRIRFYLINICAKSGHYELLVRQANEYIQYCVLHNLTLTNEFEQTIGLLVKSYVKLFSWQSLVGLHEWLSHTMTIKKGEYNWILAAAKEAQGIFLYYLAKD